jgi:hypothetical protein
LSSNDTARNGGRSACPMCSPLYQSMPRNIMGRAGGEIYFKYLSMVHKMNKLFLYIIFMGIYIHGD